MIIYILPLCVTVITLQPAMWGGSILLIKKEEEARVWECVLLLFPLDKSIWITSGRIRPSWSSHLDLEEAHTHTHTCAQLYIHVGLCRCSVVCFVMFPPHKDISKKVWMAAAGVLMSLFSAFVLFPLAAAGLWLVTDPPASVCADLQHA